MTDRDLYSEISAYATDALPMHMPGHKRNTELLGDRLPYQIDITEIDGFDDLHAQEEGGVLFEISARAARLYRAKKAFPLVNGSTGGILSAIRALSRDGDEVLVARNVHKSVYHAVELCGLSHVSLLPARDEESGVLGSIRPSDVESALAKNPQIRTVIITSPTYEGVVSDVSAIAETVHRHGARLIVDAAHGAHLGFDGSFPTFPTEADVVVTSLHKTLPSLTQTALLLVFAKEPEIASAVGRELTVFESSSPSYVLLSAIDACLRLIESDGSRLFLAYTERLSALRSALRDLKTLRLLSPDRPAFFAYDEGKLVIGSSTLSGTELADRLRQEFRIEPEMAYTDYVLCMTSLADTDESYRRLLTALREIDAREAAKTPVERRRHRPTVGAPKRLLSIREALTLPVADLKAGTPSSVYAWVYPPGVPLVVPGEEVTTELLDEIETLKKSGLKVRVGR